MHATAEEVRRGRAPIPRTRGRCLVPGVAVGSLALMLAAAAPADAQRADRRSGNRCAELAKAAREARSLDDLRTRIERQRPSEKLLRACAAALRRDSRVAGFVERERREIRSRVARSARGNPGQLSKSPEQLRVNRRVLEARREAGARLRVVERKGSGSTSRGSRSAPDRRGRRAPAPAIAQVSPSPVVPGTDLVIEGVGFGSGGGSVELVLQGSTFEATVNEWTETWISAWLGDDIDGVTESEGAVIRIRPEDGSPISRTVSFVPIYESAQLNDMAEPHLAFPLPGERDETFAANWSLENGWRLSEEPWTQSSGDIECEIDGPPVAQTGSGELDTRVHVEWDWFQLPLCFVFFEIEGPKGLEHGFESPLDIAE